MYFRQFGEQLNNYRSHLLVNLCMCAEHFPDNFKLL